MSLSGITLPTIPLTHLLPLLERNGFQVLECEVVNRDTLSVIVKKASSDGGGESSGRLCGPAAGDGELHQSTSKPGTGRRRSGGPATRDLPWQPPRIWGNTFPISLIPRPLSRGKYAPSSHLPIVGPDYFKEHPVDAIIITAPGYTEEIASIIRRDFGEKVEVRAIRASHLETI